jgi:hypothetical protein
MTSDRLDFYDEVKIENHNKKKYKDEKGVVFGISEEGGIVYGYAVYVPKFGICISISSDSVSPTGVKYKRSDFY